MKTKEMMRATAPTGYWWENVAPLGEAPDWQLSPIPPSVDPNHGVGRLFGYETAEFMARQYQRARRR